MTETYQVKCAKCRVPIEIGSNDHGVATGRCPSCGISDTKENIEREAADYAFSKAKDALDSRLSDMARGSKYMTYTKGPRHQKSYRFVVDFKPQL